MARNGTKTGGGSRKGSPNRSTLEIKSIIDECVDFKEVVLKLVELVQGVEVQEKIGREIVIYTKPPDSTAAKILMEYRFGKPQQSIELKDLREDVSLNLSQPKEE